MFLYLCDPEKKINDGLFIRTESSNTPCKKMYAATKLKTAKTSNALLKIVKFVGEQGVLQTMQHLLDGLSPHEASKSFSQLIVSFFLFLKDT